MTYNIRNGRGWDRRVDLGRVAEVIAAFDPDVLGVQEIDLDHTRSSKIDQIAELGRLLSLTPHYAPYVQGDDHHGIATLTRLPVIETRYIPLAGHARRWWISEPRCALRTRVAWPTPEGQLDIVNTHLSMVAAERRSQVTELLGVLDGPELITLGDLNCTARSSPYRLLARDLRPTSRGARTWPARFPVIGLDHILVRGALHVVRAGAWTEGPARFASDHLPMFAELEIK